MTASPAIGSSPVEPDHDCPRCPRLVAFRQHWRTRQPGWHNAPVPTLLPPDGRASVRLLIVGLAPGLRGANRTGRPFTGDFAGALLYETLIRYGFARGRFEARPDDSLELCGTAVTNAVRCVPPENKPSGAEITSCRPFLSATIASLPALAAVVALGRISHDSVARALGRRPGSLPFAHGAVHAVDGLRLYDSYHCSRQNTNTGRLTPDMFHSVFARIAAELQRVAANG